MVYPPTDDARCKEHRIISNFCRWQYDVSDHRQHCCKAHAKINRKIENLTPCKIVTHEDFNLKLVTHDYVADITHHATLGSNRPSGGFPQIEEM